jgi:hypothetical protein
MAGNERASILRKIEPETRGGVEVELSRRIKGDPNSQVKEQAPILWAVGFKPYVTNALMH